MKFNREQNNEILDDSDWIDLNDTPNEESETLDPYDETSQNDLPSESDPNSCDDTTTSSGASLRIPSLGRSSSKKKKRSKKISNKNSKKKKKNSDDDKDRSVTSAVRSTAQASAGAVGKVARAGGSVVTGSFRFTAAILNSGLRLVTQALILLTMAVIGLNFWKNYRALGTLRTIYSSRNYALCAYLAVGGVLLFFEFCAFWRASTSIKVKDGASIRRYDMGRGLCSFPLIFAGAYFAAKYASQVPLLHPALNGVQSALLLYGSMQNTLLKICFFGIVSCVARRICSKSRLMAKEFHKNLRNSRSSQND